jgi:hypothetical protein
VNIYSLDIPGGYSGTVQVTKSNIHLEQEVGAEVGYSFTAEVKCYHFCLLTPEKNNIEFYLLRFHDGEWCNTKNMYSPLQRSINDELIRHAKAAVFRLGI